jgi:serine/threonine protein kinase
MPLPTGTRIGPYEIVAAIGSGGMGEVYRARDERLQREVAIKILPAAVAADPDRLRRFTLEAQSAGSLNHPNILAIHDIGSVDGQPYLVAELLQGETLRARLNAGGVPVSKAVDFARQIAEGLAAAHARGITHRDIKPENLFVTTDGRVKILDFGIARVAGPSRDAAETRTGFGTEAGLVLGTSGYMSPEQVRGLAADGRSDLFSLGVVLYEMLAGQRPFSGDSAVETMNAILSSDPPELSAGGRALPPALGRLVAHCLEKNPEERFQSARDLAFQLGAIGSDSSERRTVGELDATRADRRKSASFLPLATTAAVALALGSAGGWLLRAPEPIEPPRVDVLTHSGRDSQPSASPDGRIVAFASTRNGVSQIWLKQIDGGTETARTRGPGDQKPRFSPDGASLLFLRDAADGIAVYRAPLLGGDEQRVVNSAWTADWSPDGSRIAFGAQAGDNRVVGHVRMDGSDRRDLRTYTDTIPVSVRWSPDGRRLAVLLLARTSAAQGSTIEIVSVDDASARTLRGATDGLYLLFADVAWISANEIVYAAMPNMLSLTTSRLLRHDVDADRVLTLASGLRSTVTVDVVTDGTLVIDATDNVNAVRHVPLVDAGETKELMRTMSLDRQPAFSPDGQRVILSSARSGNMDLWVMTIADGSLRRVTDNATVDWDPAYSPDGRSILWSSHRTGHFEIWMANADGSGARQVSQDGVNAESPTMTKDGKWIVYTSGNPQKRGIWRIRPDGTAAAPVARGSYVLPEVSPDGRHVAFLGEASADGRDILVYRVEDGAPVDFRVRVPRSDRDDGNFGRLRWMPGTGAIVFRARDERGLMGLFVQDFVPGRDTTATRRKLGAFFQDAPVESFGIAPDGRSVIVSGFESRTDLLLVSRLPGIRRPMTR